MELTLGKLCARRAISPRNGLAESNRCVLRLLYRVRPTPLGRTHLPGYEDFVFVVGHRQSRP